MDPFGSSPQQRTLEAEIIAIKMDVDYWQPNDIQVVLAAILRYGDRNCYRLSRSEPWLP